MPHKSLDLDLEIGSAYFKKIRIRILFSNPDPALYFIFESGSDSVSEIIIPHLDVANNFGSDQVRIRIRHTMSNNRADI